MIEFDHIRFPDFENEKLFETMIEYRSIWEERQVNLDEIYPFFHRNLQSRNWLSSCSNLVCLPATLVREFYANLFIHFDDSSGHYLTTWIIGEEFHITKKVLSYAFNISLIHRPIFPYIESTSINDVLTLLCGRSVT